MNKKKTGNHSKIFGVFSGLLLAALILALIPAGYLHSQTLSEGLWKEFVEGDTGAARTIYENIVNKTATDETVIQKARMRLKAIGESSNIGVSSATKSSFAIARLNLKFLLNKLKSRAMNKENAAGVNVLMDNIKSELSTFIKEDLKSHSLPEIFIISRNSSLSLNAVDIILSFDKDVTFKAGEAASAYNINGYNIDWKTLLISTISSESEIISEYKKIGFWNEPDNNAGIQSGLYNIYDHCFKNAPFDISFYTDDLERFIGVNKIMPAYFKSVPKINEASIMLDNKRLILSTAAELSDINRFLSALDSFTGLKILPASIIHNEKKGHQVKLIGIEELYDILMQALPYINKKYSAARQLSVYKSCLANLRNITSVTELYSMENENFKKENIKDGFIQELFFKQYLKTEPVCAAGGKYIYKNSEFMCTAHGSNSKIIEFKIVKLTDGKEKIISAPKIKTLIFHDSAITIGTQKATDETAEVDINKAGRTMDGVAETLKFLKLAIRISKDEETAETDYIIAAISVSAIIYAGENKERSVQFNSKYKISCGTDKWTEIGEVQNNALKDFKIYMKIY